MISRRRKGSRLSPTCRGRNPTTQASGQPAPPADPRAERRLTGRPPGELLAKRTSPRHLENRTGKVPDGPMAQHGRRPISASNGIIGSTRTLTGKRAIEWTSIRCCGSLRLEPSRRSPHQPKRLFRQAEPPWWAFNQISIQPYVHLPEYSCKRTESEQRPLAVLRAGAPAGNRAPCLSQSSFIRRRKRTFLAFSQCSSPFSHNIRSLTETETGG
jgi:hypothetical protein